MRLRPLIIAIIVAFVCEIYLYQVTYNQTWQHAELHLTQVLNSISHQVQEKGLNEANWINVLSKDAENKFMRLTIMNPLGKVLADNHGDPDLMDNHSLRPEVKTAIKSEQHIGRSIRRSRTTGISYLYIAKAVRDQQNQIIFITRIGLPTNSVDQGSLTQFLAVSLPLLVILSTITLAVYLKPQSTIEIQANSSEHPTPLYKQNRSETADAERVIWQKDRAFNLPAMLNSLNEGIIAVNKDEKVVYLNNAAAKILRCPTNEALGHSIWDLSRINIIPETIHKCLSEPIERSCEFQVLHNVKDVHYALHVTPIFTNEDQSNVYAAVAIIDDITDQQNIEGIRRNFFTNVSHELKTPLAVIRGVVETMIDDKDMTGKQRNIFLDKAMSQCLRLSTLVGDILTIARLEDLETLKERENISVASVLRECVRSLQSRAEQKKISIEIQTPEDSCPISGDREMIQQVFDNLISNAINYSAAESQVKTLLEVKADWYQVSVIDNGPGIPPHALERIFERFYRVDKARSRQVGGTGLGLSIAKHAVALHGGKISVRSEISKGSTFIVQLPKITEPATEDPTHDHT